MFERLELAWNALAGNIRFKRDPTGAVTASGGNRKGQVQWTGQDYVPQSKESYMRNAIFKRCVDMLGTNFAGLQICLRKKPTSKAGKWEEIDDLTHPLLALLNKPNPWMSGKQFKANWAAYLMLHGNTYVVGNGSQTAISTAAPPVELWNMRPDRVTIIPSEDNLPASYRYKVGQVQQDFPVNWIDGTSQVLHFKTFNPIDDFYGMPPIRAIAMDVDQHNAAGEWNMNVLQNAGRPSGSIKYDPAGAPGAILARPQREQLEKDIDILVSGPRNAKRPIILDGGLTWEAMSLNAEELDWLEGRRDAARIIALGTGTPSQMLGIPGDNTYANYEQARLAYYEDTVVPFHADFLGALNNWLVPLFGDDLELFADLNDVSALALRRKEVFDMVNASEFLTTNEKRDALSYEPLDDPAADEVLIPSTLMPLSQVQDMGDAKLTSAQNAADNTDPATVNARAAQAAKVPPGKKPAFGKGVDLSTPEGMARYTKALKGDY